LSLWDLNLIPLQSNSLSTIQCYLVSLFEPSKIDLTVTVVICGDQNHYSYQAVRLQGLINQSVSQAINLYRAKILKDIKSLKHVDLLN